MQRFSHPIGSPVWPLVRHPSRLLALPHTLRLKMGLRDLFNSNKGPAREEVPQRIAPFPEKQRF